MTAFLFWARTLLINSGSHLSWKTFDTLLIWRINFPYSEEISRFPLALENLENEKFFQTGKNEKYFLGFIGKLGKTRQESNFEN